MTAADQEANNRKWQNGCTEGLQWAERYATKKQRSDLLEQYDQWRKHQHFQKDGQDVPHPPTVFHWRSFVLHNESFAGEPSVRMFEAIHPEHAGNKELHDTFWLAMFENGWAELVNDRDFLTGFISSAIGRLRHIPVSGPHSD